MEQSLVKETGIGTVEATKLKENLEFLYNGLKCDELETVKTKLGNGTKVEVTRNGKVLIDYTLVTDRFTTSLYMTTFFKG